MEDILRAIVLGIVQGLTEFLPISSSGHLIAVRDLLDWQVTDDLTFDVSLHLGTTAAILVFFWREWTQMLRSGLARLTGQRRPEWASVYDDRLLLLVVAGSIPVGIVGVLLGDWIEEEVRDPVIVGVMLIVFGAILLAADWIGRRQRTLDDINLLDVAIIGSAQAISLVPGVSRSGVTISAGLLLGYTREEAARFSFVLSTPAILGAGVLTLGDAISNDELSGNIDTIIIGAVIAGIVGWLSIEVLLRLVQTRSFLPFVAYRLVAGAFLIVYFGL
ncbi:MAG TPA: undecaprenyl-diphosphatase UppP [Dehalococcoidia bacterium]|nr:undecaprenyl-diphosphatase UppP [Dehalococcoidia bacterium]